jgi:hypothetical protein
VAGTSHLIAGRRCEDSWAWARSGDSGIVVAVADGVGTAGRGGEGADIAAEVASRWLALAERSGEERGGKASGEPDGEAQEEPGEKSGEEGNGEAACRAAITAANRELAAYGGMAAAELSTTLVVATLDSSGKAALARVGDSTAMLLGKDGAWRELFGGAGAGTEDPLLGLTAALPAEPSPCAESDSVDLTSTVALVLMTDGLAEPLRDGPGTVAPAFAELARRASKGNVSPLGLAEALNFSRRGAHDDRCAVLVWLAP